jgi:nitroreductase
MSELGEHHRLTRRAFVRGCGALVLGACVQTACSADNPATAYAALAADIRRRGDGTRGSRSGVLQELVRYATLAANSHNTQPWRFRLEPNAITITPDLSRRCTAVDPDNHHLYASLGCAAENLVHAAAAHGFDAAVQFDDTADGAVRVELAPAEPVDSSLFRAIPARQCTRAEFTGEPVAPADIATLEATARDAGVLVRLYTARDDLERLLELVVAGNTAQMRDAAFMRELRQWIRFNEQAAVATRDGLFSASSGNPRVPSWMGNLVFRFAFTESSENDRYARQLRSSAGAIAFVGERETPASWMDVGRCSQRFALQATAIGLKHSFINQPVEVPKLREQLADFLGLKEQRPDLLMRFGYGPSLPMSLRRAIGEVIT